jgi:hypothetical protein
MQSALAPVRAYDLTPIVIAESKRQRALYRNVQDREVTPPEDIAVEALAVLKRSDDLAAIVDSRCIGKGGTWTVDLRNGGPGTGPHPDAQKRQSDDRQKALVQPHSVSPSNVWQCERPRDAVEDVGIHLAVAQFLKETRMSTNCGSDSGTFRARVVGTSERGNGRARRTSRRRHLESGAQVGAWGAQIRQVHCPSVRVTRA